MVNVTPQLGSLGRYFKVIVHCYSTGTYGEATGCLYYNNFNRIFSNVTPAVVCNFQKEFMDLYL